MRKAIINSDGLVVNIIEIKSKAKWQPPEGCSLIAAGKGSPGDTWDGEKFIKPEYIELEPVMDYKAEILKLQDEVKKLKEKGLTPPR